MGMVGIRCLPWSADLSRYGAVEDGAHILQIDALGDKSPANAARQNESDGAVLDLFVARHVPDQLVRVPIDALNTRRIGGQP